MTLSSSARRAVLLGSLLIAAPATAATVRRFLGLDIDLWNNFTDRCLSHGGIPVDGSGTKTCYFMYDGEPSIVTCYAPGFCWFEQPGSDWPDTPPGGPECWEGEECTAHCPQIPGVGVFCGEPDGKDPFGYDFPLPDSIKDPPSPPRAPDATLPIDQMRYETTVCEKPGCLDGIAKPPQTLACKDAVPSCLEEAAVACATSGVLCAHALEDCDSVIASCSAEMSCEERLVTCESEEKLQCEATPALCGKARAEMCDKIASDCK